MVRFNLQLFAKSVDDLAKEVIKGNWGNGETRKTKLTNAGYDYSTVQARVNEMLGVGSKTTSTTNTAKANTSAPKVTTTPSPTTTNVQKTPEIKGVDGSLVDTINSKFEASDELKGLEQTYTGYGQNYLDFASNTDIISSDVWAGLLTPYSKSSAVLQAEQLLQSKIEQGYAGTHKEALNNLLNEIMNREDFEYDVDKDQMFQQALASAMGSGKTAMQDTMGQAAALTGGYGSTYATTAGNQAYNAFIEDAYNNLPEYYNMALAAYEAEGQQMLQQYNVLDAADTKEYSQWYDEINMDYQRTRDMVNDEYNAWNANNTMYANAASMQLSENAQIGSNLYNAYSVTSDMYMNKYTQDVQNWQQSIDSAYKLANLQSSDYWNNETMAFQKSESAREQSNWEKSYALDLASAGASADSKGNVVVNNPKGSTLTNTELEKVKQVWAQSGGDVEQVDNYLTTIGKNDLDDDANAALMAQLTSDNAYKEWEISNDTFNWFWGDDNNDEYTNVIIDDNGNKVKGDITLTYKELKEAINNSDMPEEQKKAKLKALKEQQK